MSLDRRGTGPARTGRGAAHSEDRERSGGGDFAAEDPAYTIDALGAPVEVSSPLHGEHQHRNLALAIAAAVELAGGHRLPITAAAIAEGIHSTRWPGRLERIFTGQRTGRPTPPEMTEWILDVAHNPAGAWALRAALRAFLGLGEPEAPPAVLVFGCLRDKPLDELAQILFPLFDEVVFAPIQSPRATPVADLLASAAAVGTAARGAASVALALARAEEVLETPPVSVSSTGAQRRPAAFRRGPSRGAAQAVAGGENGRRVIVVAGSVYLVGEVRPLLLARAAQP